MNFIRKYWKLGYVIGGCVSFHMEHWYLGFIPNYQNKPIARAIDAAFASVFWPLTLVGMIDFNDNDP